MDYVEEFDKLKTKVLKYILFKKRTEQEVRQKFREDSGEMLDDVIEELKELNYINDENYIQRAVKEFKNLKNMSIKEIQYKLMTKGLKKDIIDNYICNNKEELLEYEIQSAKNIAIKKQNSLEREEIIAYLAKKGYLSETIKTTLRWLKRDSVCSKTTEVTNTIISDATIRSRDIW